MSVAEFKSPVEAKTPANTPSPSEIHELKPKITVVGVGGAGGNAVNNMIRSKLQGVQFVICNTDAQAITQSLAERRIQLGDEVTQGLGAGSRPEVGRAAAEESMERLVNEISGSNMVFITAGMGGGTGTGAAPVVAQAARERGILTVAVVTKPFHFEGSHRMRTAEQGIEELAQYVDTLIIIPNQNLFRIANEKTTFADAFKMADDVLYSGVRGVTDLMMMPGLINLDFADIRTVMSEMGKAMMGTGEASGEGRSIIAAEAAISNPLLDDVSMKGAQGVLINVTGGLDMTLYEVDEAANRIREEVDPDANIIFGSTFDEKMNGVMRVSVVATGIEADSSRARVQRYRLERDPRGKQDQMGAADEESEESILTDEMAAENSAAGASALETGNNNQLPGDHEVPHPHIPQQDADSLQAYKDNATPHGQPAQPAYPEHDNYYHPRYMAPENTRTQKRGFFSRLAETMRGGTTNRQEREDVRLIENNRLPQKDVPAKYHTEITEAQSSSESNLHDIPAYLRRNKKS